MPLFTLGIDEPNNATNGEMREVNGALVAGADDTYILGPTREAFQAVTRHAEKLKGSGLDLNIRNTKCYIREEYITQEY